MNKPDFTGVRKVVIMGKAEATIYRLNINGLWAAEYCDQYGNCEDMDSVTTDIVENELNIFQKMYKRNLTYKGRGENKVIAIYH